MAAFSAAVKAAGGRAMPLKVQGGFHSPYMSHAAESFRSDLNQVCFKQPRIPLYANLTAKPYNGEFVETLSAQIRHPVLWEDTIRNMMADGVDTFIELGPGKTLCGLIAKISSEVRTLCVSDAASASAVIEELGTC